MIRCSIACMLAAGTLLAALTAAAQSPRTEPIETVTYPLISQSVAPLERLTPVARDGYRGEVYVRKPPGAGPFPGAILVPYGNVTVPSEVLSDYALVGVLPSRFLAAGYAVATVNFRSRDVDPQSPAALSDVLAAFDQLGALTFIDRRSIGAYGCSNGGDLVLELAAATGTSGPAAIVLEEAATMMFAGVFNKQSPKAGEQFIPPDSAPISADPLRYYTPEFQRLTKQKIGGTQAPILVTRGSERGGRFNSEVIVPELKAAGKSVEEKTYEGEPHCFAFGGRLTDAPIAVRTPRPAVALKAFEDADAFLRRHMTIQPTPVSPNLVRDVPVPIQ